MSIIATIAVRDRGTFQKAGDIFQVRLLGSPMGRLSRREFVFLIMDDDALEARMVQQKVDFEAKHPGKVHWPSIPYPYAERNGEDVITKLSTRQINLSTLTQEQRDQIADREQDSPILARGSVTIRTR